MRINPLKVPNVYSYTANAMHVSHTEYFHPGISYFGRRVEVLFDDGEKHSGVICGRDSQTKEWITRFEDGTEDKVADLSTDKDL